MVKKYTQMVWTSENVQRFWDWQSQFPDTYFTHTFGGKIIEHVQEYLKNANEILDLGCGTGYLIPHLNRAGIDVTGADLSVESVAEANRQHAHLPHFKGAHTIDELINLDRRFEAIISVEVIEHLYDEQLVGLLDTAKRLGKPGGYVIFTTPNDENLEQSYVYCPESDVVFHRWQHVRSWTTESLSETLQSHGLEIVKIWATNLKYKPESTLKGKLQRLLRKRRHPPNLICVAKIPSDQ